MSLSGLRPPLRSEIAHVDTWVFDLDNTLYPATSHLFPQIDRRMTAFIIRLLNISEEAAYALQKQYYREYGTTLRGLMVNHGIAPDAFIDDVHDIDHSILTPDAALAAALRRLPGRRFIYTNGSALHAARVMDRLGVADLFEDVFDIKAGDYLPKPDPEPYGRMLARHGIAPNRAAMFEDSFKNLKPAADLGMVTVWVRHIEHVPEPEDDLSHCQFVTDDLATWLAALPVNESAQP